MHVPFVDLKPQYEALRTDIDRAISTIFEKTAFVMGPGVLQFEKEYAAYLGVEDVIAVSDGTNAIQVALRALGVGHGDEVIVPTHTFFASAEAVSLVGATPVFADVDPVTYHLTAEMAQEKISPRTKAIIPVHLYGQAVDLDPIYELARRHNLFIVEDAAQAHGTHYKGRKIGGGGTASTFSFYPGKNLGTCGEGGAIAVNNAELSRKMRLVRDHGSSVKYTHEVVGGNFRMSGLEGAVLSAKLPHLDSWNYARRNHATLYCELLQDTPHITLPTEPPYSKGNYHLFVIQTDNRDALRTFLKERDIESGIHYPTPIHLQQAYRSLGYTKGSFPYTEALAERIVSLPMYPELSKEQIQHVAEAIKDFVG